MERNGIDPLINVKYLLKIWIYQILYIIFAA